jgi:hypothetical protein
LDAMHPLRFRVARKLAKTVPDFLYVLERRLPPFVYGGGVDQLPVFTFHDVAPDFEQVLEYLTAAGYRTAGAADIEAWLAGGRKAVGRTIALTFDDGLSSLVRIAVPLLKAHGYRAIGFVVAGRVPERTTDRLAGWDDLQAAVRDGALEVGSHSLYHHHVPVGDRIIGFVGPRTPIEFTADLPVPTAEGPGDFPLGYPIFAGAPRYTARRVFRPAPETIDAGVAAARVSGPGLFARPGWHRTLRRLTPVRGTFASAAETDIAVVDDIRRSMLLIELHCPNPAARQLCYPWYAGDGRTDRLALAAGAAVVYRGMDGHTNGPEPDRPPGVQRLGPEFLWRLPGPARLGLWAVLRRRLGAALHKRAAGAAYG